MSQKVYNLAQLEELAGDSKEFIESMIETFLEFTPGQLEAMEAAYKSGDLSTLSGIAHKIKPNIDLFGIQGIRDDIRTIEEKGKQGINDAELKKSLTEVQNVLLESFNQLKKR